jgi:hypothetical protein
MFKKYRAYIKDNPNHYWFKRKWYGWGWSPVTWQGWSMFGIYMALVLAFATTIDENSSTREMVFTFVLPVVLLTIALLGICYAKGEKPRWQWSAPEDKPDEN